jgi:hypothetical protein
MGEMAAEDAPGAADARGEAGVLVADTVLKQMDVLDPAVQQIVARTIQTVGQENGAVPVSLTVPGSPAGAQYLALSTPDPRAPVIIYRQITPAETNLHGKWLVTTLLSAENYLTYNKLQLQRQFSGAEAMQELSVDDHGQLNRVALRAVAES